MTRPRIVVLPPDTRNPGSTSDTPVPFSSMIGVPVKPSCVVPSIVTAPVISGSGSPDTAIVCAPLPMLKVIMSAPAEAFAAVMAVRRLHVASHVASPESAAVVTSYVTTACAWRMPAPCPSTKTASATARAMTTSSGQLL